MLTRRAALTLNALSLYGVAGVLVAAFAAQFILNELPCPLCLLQRLAFALLAVGPVLNLRYGPRPSHYALSIIAALLGAGFAGRQILLHIMPGDPGYGTAILGYHYYTWAFLSFAAALLLLGLIMLFDEQFHPSQDARTPALFERAAVWLIITVAAASVLSTLVECGFRECAENPVLYELLQR
ncbi:Disulfide bond formation protein DsbB [Rhizobiales bacterium GAS188]|nr:Disulfide bond formation protein DsbB [Rhizobiales bacterium GAS188]